MHTWLIGWPERVARWCCWRRCWHTSSRTRSSPVVGGERVESVTLWLFGGVTTLGGEAKTPKAAFRIAFAGPATSLVLSAMFAGLVDSATSPCAPRPSWSVLLGGWPPSTCCWACSTCCRGPRWTVAGFVRAYLWRRHGDSVRAGDRRGACRTSGRDHLDRVGIGRVSGGRPFRRRLVGVHRLVYFRRRSRGRNAGDRPDSSLPGCASPTR